MDQNTERIKLRELSIEEKNLRGRLNVIQKDKRAAIERLGWECRSSGLASIWVHPGHGNVVDNPHECDNVISKEIDLIV